LRKILEEGHVVRNGVAIGENPFRIGKIEWIKLAISPNGRDSARGCGREDPSKLFHLIRKGMRFHERHALDRVCGKAFESGNYLEKIAATKELRRPIRISDVDAQRMFSALKST